MYTDWLNFSMENKPYKYFKGLLIGERKVQSKWDKEKLDLFEHILVFRYIFHAMSFFI